MKKILALIVIVSLVALLFVPLVSAAYVCPAAQTVTEATSGNRLAHEHPSDSTQLGSAGGMAFTANATCYLYNVSFWISRVGSISGNLTSKLYAIQAGTVGTNAFPTNTALDTSSTVSIGSVGGTGAYITFIFLGSYQIQSGTNYFISIEGTDIAGGDLSNYVNLLHSAASASFNEAIYANSVWTAATADMAFIINGDSASTGATPTPTPAPTAGTGDADIENLTAIILPWLVPLLICLIPALLGYKFVGELGFFIGLNVGVILAYVTLAGTAYAFPLWGIILVGVMDVAVVLMRR